MTQSSPPIARVVAVLNFLGGHVGQAFTLTEISKSLRISGATCHSLLGALVEAGYVYRTAAKTYVIGPAVTRLAQTTLTSEILMQVVRPEMRQLADEFDAVCSASFLENDKIIVRERAAALSHIAWDAPGLMPQSLAAPFGTIFLAWSDQQTLHQWMERAIPALGDQERQDVLDAMNFVRTHGYTFGERIVPIDSPEQALSLQNRWDKTNYLSSSIEQGATYNLAFVSTPIFTQPHQVAFALSLLGFVYPLKGKAVLAMANKLLAASERIGAFIAGRHIS